MRKLFLIIVLIFSTMGIASAQSTTTYIDPDNYGASCKDGANNTDDTNGWQNAVNAAWTTGLPIRFHGICVITGTITVKTSPSYGQLVITSESGGGVIMTTGNSVFAYTAPAGAAPALISLSNFTVMSTTQNSGVLLSVDCSNLTSFCTLPGSGMENVRMMDLICAFSGSQVNNITIDKSSLLRSAPNTQQAFVYIQGVSSNGTQEYSSDVYVTNNYVTGGILVLTSGGVQGIYVQNNKHLKGQRGFYLGNSAGTSPEQMILINNYLEESLSGIYLPICQFCQVEQNSFDPTPSGSGGVSSGYFAIQVGSGGSPQPGNTVDHNYAFDFSGSTIARMFYDNMTNGGTFDHNTVTGTVNESQCIAVGYDGAASAGSALGSVVGNTCWASGTIAIMGGVSTRGNAYTLASAASTIVKVPDAN